MSVINTAKHNSQWDVGKIRRFIDAWNDGVYLDDMKERFGCQPGAMAAHLRRRGFKLDKRKHDSS